MEHPMSSLAVSGFPRSQVRRLTGVPLRKLGYMLLAAAAALPFAFPVLFMMTSSFKAEWEIQAVPVHWLPHDFQGLAQYVHAADLAPLWRYFFNSALMSLINVVVTCFFSALAGYGFAKFRFPGRTFLFYFIIATMMIPLQILVVPLFVEIRAFGWQDTYAGLIVPGIMNAFGVFMMRQYAGELPTELVEAGRMDGAGECVIFLRIILPLLAPALTSLGIIIFIWSWGNFLWPLVAVQDRDLTVLAVGLTNYTQPYNSGMQWAAAMAASTVATLPIAAIFVFLQRYFIKGLTAAAVKG
jgi:ABC-type glycerol-3-phosphate transport system permease component